MVSIQYAIEQACAHYPYSDYNLFLQGITQIIQDGLNGKKILEVCCGEGDLSGWLASAFPKAEIIGIDWENTSIEKSKTKYSNLRNTKFLCGDVLNLKHLNDSSLDIIVGQATLHHLSHNLIAASKEFSRVLKPGGKCIFIFEPLGHNPIISAIRAGINSRKQLLDESNLFERAFEIFSSNFSKHEVYYFNLLNYVCKILPKSSFSKWISKIFYKLDLLIFKKFSFAKKYSANINICYWK